MVRQLIRRPRVDAGHVLQIEQPQAFLRSLGMALNMDLAS